jgi:F-type H+-transporting ATPase subunit alpha
LITGIKVIDRFFPIGLGQRQFIIGDRYTGKTTIAVDSILYQKKTKIKCIYVSIGQKKSDVNKLISTFIKAKASSYTTVISTDSSEPVAMQFLAPYTGCSLAEIFSVLGGDVLIVYDDLSKHARAYRQMALLLRKSRNSRDGYPSDIFYLHSNFLERVGHFFTGSLTALPIVSIPPRNLAVYTSSISIVDGQIFLDSSYFNRGILPPVNRFKSKRALKP